MGACPSTSSARARRCYEYDAREAKKLLAEAGHPNGFPATIDFTTYGSTVLVDAMQLILKYLKDIGIDAKLNTKEYGAYITDHVLRQVRLDGLRPTDAVPRAGQLPVPVQRAKGSSRIRAT